MWSLKNEIAEKISHLMKKVLFHQDNAAFLKHRFKRLFLMSHDLMSKFSNNEDVFAIAEACSEAKVKSYYKSQAEMLENRFNRYLVLDCVCVEKRNQILLKEDFN